MDLENEVAQQKRIRLPGNVSSTYFTVAVTDVLTFVSTERNASSPFLRLPPELRLRIYELVLGGQTLHIVENFARRPRERLVLLPYLCKEPASEENIQIAFDSPDAAWNTPAAPSRHERCYSGWQTPGGLESSLLKTCRQIYNEANIVRYSSNTFSFHADFPECLKLFYRQVPARYRNAIRRLHLSINIRHGARLPEARRWADIFRSLSHHWKGIQRLYLTINLVPFCLDFELFAYQPPSESQIVSCMLQEAKMDLKVATVTIDEDPPCTWDHPYLTESHLIWTMAQKKEMSLYLRKALLCHGNIETGLAEEEA